MSAAAALATGCSSDATSTGSASTPTSVARTERLCAGKPLDQATVASCPAPAGVRPGRACEGAAACPSPNLLFGTCRCDGGSWSCDAPTPPKGYDPYPDCVDEGVETGAACYLESSTCLPATASVCFTQDVPLCRCENHAWHC